MPNNPILPLERVNKTLCGGKPDKLPIMVANSNTFICQYYGITVEQFLNEPSLTAELTKKFIKEFEVDYCVIANGYILYGCGPELGVRWEFAGENFPGFVEGFLKSRDNLDKIKVPTSPSGYFKNYLEMIRLINKELGDEVFLIASILGPFSIACFIRGIEQVLLDTMLDLDFFHVYMKRCTELSKYFGRHILATGLKIGLLNEIFLTPEMVGPPFYHTHIAPYDREVQIYLGPERSPNSLAAAMGKPDDPISQKEGLFVYQALYGTTESVETIKKAVGYRLPGFPLPVSISGRALTSWSKDDLLGFLDEALSYLVREEGLYPAICLISVQAESREKSSEIADKMKTIAEFRNQYEI